MANSPFLRRDKGCNKRARQTECWQKDAATVKLNGNSLCQTGWESTVLPPTHTSAHRASQPTQAVSASRVSLLSSQTHKKIQGGKKNEKERK